MEMEVITGLSNYFLDAAHTLDSLPEEVYSSMPCIGDIYEKNG